MKLSDILLLRPATLVQDRLLKAMDLGILTIDRGSDDSERTCLVESVIDEITEDLPTEIQQWKVSQIYEIQSCAQNAGKYFAWFANRFSYLVAIYAISVRRAIQFSEPTIFCAEDSEYTILH